MNWGQGNINPAGADPLFLTALADNWTTLSVQYNAVTGQSTLIDSAANFVPQAFVGLFLKPAMGVFQSPIVSNTATQIVVWGDCRTLVQVGDAYEVRDYRVQPGSPVIDVGSGAKGKIGNAALV